MTLVEASDALHARVRAFAEGKASDDFEALALAIARFQAEHSPRFAALVKSRNARLESVDAVPAVPTDAFRVTRVAVHPPERDRVRFMTSGTTRARAAHGVHPLRTTETYETVALIAGARALLAERGPRVVVSLAPVPDQPPSSSLGFMMELFQARWDGRALDGGPFVTRDTARFLVGPSGVDVAGLERAAGVARERDEPLLVLATAFALVGLVDALGERRLAAPPSTTVMVTGGFKGRSREVEKNTLRRDVALAFGIPESHVVAEYGMTELSSQLYEGTLPGADLRGEPDVLFEPPWLRVVPVDPGTLEPVADGAIGIARIVDLANVDSAVAVQTEDLVRRRDDGIELIGRRPGAIARGCSLALEALLQ